MKKLTKVTKVNIVTLYKLQLLLEMVHHALGMNEISSKSQDLNLDYFSVFLIPSYTFDQPLGSRITGSSGFMSIC